MEQKKIGFIGLGDMGKPMAKRLVKTGFDVTVCGHIRRSPVEELKALGAREVKTPGQVAEASDVIITMVRDNAQTEELIWGRGAVLERARPGSTILIMSTVSPSLCSRAAREAHQKGIGVLDAPVSGANFGAEAGTLTIMVGGEEALFNRCRPIFQAMGKNIFHLGNIGMGQMAKLTNNLLLFVNLFAVTEGLSLGYKAGIKMDVLQSLIKVSSGNSWALEHWDFFAAMKKRHNPANFAVISEEIEMALELAEELEVDLPITVLAARLDIGRLPQD